MATAGKVGRVLVQSQDAPVAFANEATTASQDRKRYTITDATKCYWDNTCDISVKLNNQTVTTDYTVEYPGGVIVFDTALLETDVVEVSGQYVIVEQLAGFFSWSLTVNSKTIDSTCFESGEWEEFVLGTKNFNATAEKYWKTSEDFSQRIGSEVIVVLYCDFGIAQTRFEGYATFETNDINSGAGELIKDKLSFKGTKGIYFRAA
ncbi:MAG TPA: hypothetical protein VEC37_19990 [Bacillota bacterium]|nr:hypothetical protein [Bacillota bacterium]